MLSNLALNVKVQDVMTSPAVTVSPDATLYDSLVAMRANNHSGLPVVDATREVVGVLSERDVARIFAEGLSEKRVRALLDVLLVGLADQPHPSLRAARASLEETRVRDAMSSPPYVIRPDAPLELAAEVMTENRINRLPVVDRKHLVGIVTRSDLVRGMVRVRR